MEVDIEKLKKRCLAEIDKEAQLEQGQTKAGVTTIAMCLYHRGRKQVWLDVHQRLVTGVV